MSNKIKPKSSAKFKLPLYEFYVAANDDFRTDDEIIKRTKSCAGVETNEAVLVYKYAEDLLAANANIRAVFVRIKGERETTYTARKNGGIILPFNRRGN